MLHDLPACLRSSRSAATSPSPSTTIITGHTTSCSRTALAPTRSSSSSLPKFLPANSPAVTLSIPSHSWSSSMFNAVQCSSQKSKMMAGPPDPIYVSKQTNKCAGDTTPCLPLALASLVGIELAWNVSAHLPRRHRYPGRRP
ncbi:hypothetical protein FA13DRAFT_1894473 [Coprinellus micaceus]|uniref:Uncharacterized protein n=1 Tax=Coprinellus micaceus TaxID=71717 RepID=A0A4Y7RL33_COPMI|nr:hypothetical protein FA13DRAFT_1894473 [Coprinellus micaceus]